MGSQSETTLAYIAGFLDGDGSLMVQIKKRTDRVVKRTRFMLTICFYQDTRHEETLFWIQSILGIGYISRRNDGITELRINGYEQVRNILQKLFPYIRFKRKQAEAIIKIANLLLASNKREETILKEIVDLILIIQSENYVTKRKKTKEELLLVLGLTP